MGTPNGIVQNKSWSGLRARCAWLLSKLPRGVRHSMVTWQEGELPPDSMDAINQLIHFTSVSNAEHLYQSEAVMIRALDVDTMRTNAHKTFLLFGEEDGWVPPTYCEEIMTLVPEARYSTGIPVRMHSAFATATKSHRCVGMTSMR